MVGPDPEKPGGGGETSGGRPDAGASEGFRCGYVAICGYPNVGKSTLLNAIVGERLGIVTAKPQTTRRRTLGIQTTAASQMIFVDTPGILAPRYELHGAMMRLVEQSLADADLVLYLTDVRRPRLAPGVVAVAQRKPLVVALNKADLLAQPEESLPRIAELQSQVPDAEFFVIAARHGGGVPALAAHLATRLPVGPPLYPTDQLTEHPERFFVAELIREAVFTRFRQEVPYSSEIELTEFREQAGAKDHIEATIFVESESQKGILVGHAGESIRALGQQARLAIEAFLGRPVFLALRVRVLPNWRRDQGALRRLGYGGDRPSRSPRRP